MSHSMPLSFSFGEFYSIIDKENGYKTVGGFFQNYSILIGNGMLIFKAFN